MPSTRRNSLGRNHNKLGRFTPRAPRKVSHATRKSHGHQLTIGSKAQVWHGTAHHTSGGLTKDKLMQKSSGKIVSRKASAAGKKAMARLEKSGKKAEPFKAK
jgi:hypothetical protein